MPGTPSNTHPGNEIPTFKKGTVGSIVTIIVSCALFACGAEDSSDNSPARTPKGTVDGPGRSLLDSLKQQGRVTKKEAMIGGICN